MTNPAILGGYWNGLGAGQQARDQLSLQAAALAARNAQGSGSSPTVMPMPNFDDNSTPLAARVAAQPVAGVGGGGQAPQPAVPLSDGLSPSDRRVGTGSDSPDDSLIQLYEHQAAREYTAGNADKAADYTAKAGALRAGAIRKQMDQAMQQSAVNPNDLQPFANVINANSSLFGRTVTGTGYDPASKSYWMDVTPLGGTTDIKQSTGPDGETVLSTPSTLSSVGPDGEISQPSQQTQRVSFGSRDELVQRLQQMSDPEGATKAEQSRIQKRIEEQDKSTIDVNAYGQKLDLYDKHAVATPTKAEDPYAQAEKLRPMMKEIDTMAVERYGDKDPMGKPQANKKSSDISQLASRVLLGNPSLPPQVAVDIAEGAVSDPTRSGMATLRNGMRVPAVTYVGRDGKPQTYLLDKPGARAYSAPLAPSPPAPGGPAPQPLAAASGPTTPQQADAFNAMQRLSPQAIDENRRLQSLFGNQPQLPLQH